jgi:hypothetical protein
MQVLVGGEPSKHCWIDGNRCKRIVVAIQLQHPVLASVQNANNAQQTDKYSWSLSARPNSHGQ